LPVGHGPVSVAHTSGSTSLPIAVSTNGAMVRASRAARLRCFANNKVDWTRNLAVRLGNTTAPTDRPEGERRGRWGPPWAPDQGSVWELNVKLPADLVLSFLRENGCGYLNTGAAPAHVFALEAERMGLTAPRLDAVLAQGASVGQADREICERVFGARIIETYGSKEGGQIAHPCELGVLHVNAELCLVEIVDEGGRVVENGRPGRVVVTPFYSSAQPLIRYDQGDIARIGSGCACGRHSPTLLAIEGRHSLFFTHPDGRRVSSLVPDEGRALLNCTFWQIAQTGPRDFEVRYVPNASDVIGDEAGFILLFRAQYFEDANVVLKRVATIPLTVSGKFVEYRVEMHPADGFVDMSRSE